MCRDNHGFKTHSSLKGLKTLELMVTKPNINPIPNLAKCRNLVCCCTVAINTQKITIINTIFLVFSLVTNHLDHI